MSVDQVITAVVTSGAVSISVIESDTGAFLAEANDLSETEAGDWLSRWMKGEFA